MSLIPILYSSTDPAAPQLTGQVGSLVALLDAVLVNGYGIGPAAKPGAGWTQEFTGSNKRAYRIDPVIGSGIYFRVDDSATIAGSNARSAHVRAYETMTDIDTGVNGCPTPAQLEFGDTWAKSLTLNAVARPWVVIATAKWFYLFVDVNGTGSATMVAFYAGDMPSYVPGDRYCFLVSNGAKGVAHAGTAGVDISRGLYTDGQLNTSPGNGRGAYVMRAASGVPGAVPVSLVLPRTAGSGLALASLGSVGTSYPSPINNGLFAEEPIFREGINLPRGVLGGCYNPWHPLPFADMEVKEGLSGFPGATILAKTYRPVNAGSSTGTGQVLFDMTTPVA